MKKIIFIIFSIFVALVETKYAFADHGNDSNTPSVYKVTMSKLELCTSSACTDSTILTEATKTFNIASANAGASVGSWIDNFALEIGKTYTHIRVTISTTFTISGYTANAGISSSYCVTESSPNTASAANQGPIVDGSNTTTSAEMSWVAPNDLDADNGNPYSTVNFSSTYNITRVNNADTMLWVGALANPYTADINSTPTIKVSFDVDHQLKSSQQGANTCYMWVLPPTVSVSLTD